MICFYLTQLKKVSSVYLSFTSKLENLISGTKERGAAG